MSPDLSMRTEVPKNVSDFKKENDDWQLALADVDFKVDK